MAPQYDPDWKPAKGWVVDTVNASRCKGVSPKDILTFDGDGTSATSSLTNTTTKSLWSSGFSYDPANDRIGDAPNNGSHYKIERFSGTSPTLKCIQSSGGTAWTAHEGG